MPLPCAAAPAAWFTTTAAAAGTPGLATGTDGCAENCGGLTMVPAGVPGASVGAAAAAGCVTRPVNACWSSGASRSARVFCRW